MKFEREFQSESYRECKLDPVVLYIFFIITCKGNKVELTLKLCQHCLMAQQPMKRNQSVRYKDKFSRPITALKKRAAPIRTHSKTKELVPSTGRTAREAWTAVIG